MINNSNEWVKAVDLINGCIATLNCGCHVTVDEEVYAESLYYRAKQFLRVYEDWKARNK